MTRFSARRTMSAAAVVMLAAVLVAGDASARIGSGRSSGSRGSRSYSVPGRPAPQQSPRYNPAPAPYSPMPQQQPRGGFLRSMAGGLLGGFIGGMLFRSLGFGGGWGGGGGIGLFDIILIGGLLYLIYRMVSRRRAESSGNSHYSSPARDYTPPSQPYQQPYQPAYQEEDRSADPLSGLAHIRQMDPSFNEDRFSDEAMDLFFRIQGGWMHRDIDSILPLLTAEMATTIRRDMDDLRARKRINRLENIAVRSTDAVEAWQESGQDFVTVRFLANLLDYLVDETTGAVVEGSKTEPVKFEEFWTFTRPVGPGAWKLSAITQP